MAKDKNKKESGTEMATYIPPQQTQYVQSYSPTGPQPYMPRTQPITPTVTPINPSTAVLADDSVIIAPKKPPRSLRPLTFKAIFWGILLFALFTFVAFTILTYFFVDVWNPFKIIADFFTTFDFGTFFKDFFSGKR